MMLLYPKADDPDKSTDTKEKVEDKVEGMKRV